MNAFKAADVLLIPKVQDMEAWSVIACDQFTSQPEYWEEARSRVGDAPSSLRLILPEAELGLKERVGAIPGVMQRYLEEGLFQGYPNAYVYVERTLQDGSIRRGVVGVVDLEAYDYRPSAAAVRATERTVAERLPPRMAVRELAPLELSHVLLLCDDAGRTLIEPLGQEREKLPKLYGFDLMMGGGHIDGWLVQGAAASAFDERMGRYLEGREGLFPFAVGDGNHSLATAKECWEAIKRNAGSGQSLPCHPARYAMVELENIHDPALRFEPIHRVVKRVQDSGAFLKGLEEFCAEGGYPIPWTSGGQSGTLYLDRKLGSLPLAALQRALDARVPDPGDIDYIHGEDVLERLAAQDGAIGFRLPPIEKGRFFQWIADEGVLPRKTFSMGHAREKRYYLEARKIVP